jgi:DNA-directed RNA polymerase subunit RPC12/RpoP/cell division protein FtsL
VKKLILLSVLVCTISYGMDKDRELLEKEKAWLEIGKQRLEIERDNLRLGQERLAAQQRANDIAELSAALEVMKLVGNSKHDDNNFGYRCKECGARFAGSAHADHEDPKMRAISSVTCSRCGFKDYERTGIEPLKRNAAVVILNHKFNPGK